MKILQHPAGTYEIEFLNNSIRIEESPAHYGIAGIYTRQTLVDGHNLTTAIKFTHKNDLHILLAELNTFFGWNGQIQINKELSEVKDALKVSTNENENSQALIAAQEKEINLLNKQKQSLEAQLATVNTLATLAEKLINKLNYLR